MFLAGPNSFPDPRFRSPNPRTRIARPTAGGPSERGLLARLRAQRPAPSAVKRTRPSSPRRPKGRFADYTADMTFLEHVCRALGDAGVDYAVVGGQAVALHGVVRGTIDVDVALRWSSSMLSRAEAALRGIGLVSQLPLTAAEVFEHRDDYVADRNLAAWSFHDPSAPLRQVDIVIAYDLAGKRTERIELDDGTACVLAIGDLIDMKRRTGRAQDVADVEALRKQIE